MQVLFPINLAQPEDRICSFRKKIIMVCRVVDGEISLIAYYPDYATALEWYQDRDVVKQVDNREEPYDLPLLKAMYGYLDKNGHLFYIQYQNRLCGDVCLKNDGELAIVICKEYQNKHIGRRVIREMIAFAKELHFREVYATIYSFNGQSQRMFASLGFRKTEEEKYAYRITEE